MTPKNRTRFPTRSLATCEAIKSHLFSEVNTFFAAHSGSFFSFFVSLDYPRRVWASEIHSSFSIWKIIFHSFTSARKFYGNYQCLPMVKLSIRFNNRSLIPFKHHRKRQSSDQASALLYLINVSLRSCILGWIIGEWLRSLRLSPTPLMTASLQWCAQHHVEILITAATGYFSTNAVH